MERRDFIRLMLLGGGVALSGCRRTQEIKDQASRKTGTPEPESTATLVLPTTTEVPTVTSTELPTATEIPKTPEQLAREFEKMLWKIPKDKPLKFLAQPIKRDVNDEWQIDDKKPVEELFFSGIDFRIENVSVNEQEDGSIIYGGYVSGVTGDHRIHYVELGRQTESGWELFAEPLEEYQKGESGIVASYLYIVRESSFYLDKAHNVSMTAQLLVESMVNEAIKANGGRFDFLERVNAAENFFKKELYEMGWAIVNGRLVLVQAGGACGNATPTARALAQVEALGYGKKIVGHPHSHRTYEDMPGGGEEDKEDVTVFYSPDPRYLEEFIWENTSDEDMWIGYKISYCPYGEYPKGRSSTASPSPVAMAMQVLVYKGKRPPVEEMVSDLKEGIKFLGEFK